MAQSPAVLSCCTTQTTRFSRSETGRRTTNSPRPSTRTSNNSLACQVCLPSVQCASASPHFCIIRRIKRRGDHYTGRDCSQGDGYRHKIATYTSLIDCYSQESSSILLPARELYRSLDSASSTQLPDYRCFCIQSRSSSVPAYCTAITPS